MIMTDGLNLVEDVDTIQAKQVRSQSLIAGSAVIDCREIIANGH